MESIMKTLFAILVVLGIMVFTHYAVEHDASFYHERHFVAEEGRRNFGLFCHPSGVTARIDIGYKSMDEFIGNKSRDEFYSELDEDHAKFSIETKEWARLLDLVENHTPLGLLVLVDDYVVADSLGELRGSPNDEYSFRVSIQAPTALLTGIRDAQRSVAVIIYGRDTGITVESSFSAQRSARVMSQFIENCLSARQMIEAYG